MATALVIPAAGTGSRFGGPIAKQFIAIHGVPVLTWTLRAFAGLVDAVILVGNDRSALRAAASQAGFDPIIVPGGSTRQQSVAHGLAAVPSACSIVLIHDAVRPGVPRGCITACIDALRSAPAAVVASACTATVKRATADGSVAATIPRDDLWLAQTPQGLHRNEGLAAFARAAAEGWTCTDDAEVMERAGHRVVIVPGDTRNLKLTTADDLALLSALLAAPSDLRLQPPIAKLTAPLP